MHKNLFALVAIAMSFLASDALAKGSVADTISGKSDNSAPQSLSGTQSNKKSEYETANSARSEKTGILNSSKQGQTSAANSTKSSGIIKKGGGMDQQMQAYMQVKDKSWGQLNAKEQAYAKQNGIANESIYNAWKAQQAARLAPPPAPVAVAPTPISPAMPAPVATTPPPPKPALTEQQKKELEVYNNVKDKAWNDLSTQEVNYAIQNGIHNKAEYDAWKMKQAILAADAPPLMEAARVLDVAGVRTKNTKTHSPSSVSK